jgi:chemotaxis protein CheD
LLTRLYQLLFPVNTLNTNLTKTPKTSTSFLPSTVVQNSTAQSTVEVRVDMADMKVESRPVTLITNVGSCVAICIHDSINKCGGLAHIMLPDSSINHRDPLPSKYANTAVPALVKAIQEIGNGSFRFSAKIAGGANMFPNLKSDTLKIGMKNVEAVKQVLTEHRIRLLAEDVQGTHGRRVSFNVANGSMCVRNGVGEVKEY